MIVVSSHTKVWLMLFSLREIFSKIHTFGYLLFS